MILSLSLSLGRIPVLTGIILTTVFLYDGKCYSQDSLLVTHSMYHEYGGNYQLPDGKIITGGLMDEMKGHMIFLEPIHVSTGGVFRPVAEDEFQSLPPNNIRIHFQMDRKGSVEGLWWVEQGADSVFATKFMPHLLENIQFQNKNVTLSAPCSTILLLCW